MPRIQLGETGNEANMDSKCSSLSLIYEVSSSPEQKESMSEVSVQNPGM